VFFCRRAGRLLRSSLAAHGLDASESISYIEYNPILGRAFNHRRAGIAWLSPANKNALHPAKHVQGTLYEAAICPSRSPGASSSKPDVISFSPSDLMNSNTVAPETQHHAGTSETCTFSSSKKRALLTGPRSFVTSHPVSAEGRFCRDLPLLLTRR
jgi:hypothetical protein